MTEKSIKKNFVYNIFYRLLTVIMPLITAPYIARIIGPNGNGIHSYTISIANYFVVFAMLGILNYGNRLIAKVRNDEKKLSIEFSSLFYLHIIISIISLILYFVFIFIWGSNYKIYFILQSITIISAMLDINWLFFGLEEFKITVTRNSIVKVLSLILIFTCIKSSNDLIVYILIINGQSLLSNLFLFPFLKEKGVSFVKVKKRDIIKHIKPLLILFIPVIALSLYKTMDKVMLGNIVNVSEVAFYDYAERIITIPLSLVTALSTVMMPRISNLSTSKKNDIIIQGYIDKSMRIMLFISVGICFGLIGVSENFIPFFLGNDYNKVIYIVELLALTAPIITYANIIREQYLIPKNMDKAFIISIFFGAIVNLCLNIVLIHKYQAIGAAIATIIAELVVMIYQSLSVKKMLNIKRYYLIFIKYIPSALLMLMVIILLKNITTIKIINIVIQIIVGLSIYLLFNYRYILELIKEINIKKYFKRK